MFILHIEPTSSDVDFIHNTHSLRCLYYTFNPLPEMFILHIEPTSSDVYFTHRTHFLRSLFYTSNLLPQIFILHIKPTSSDVYLTHRTHFLRCLLSEPRPRIGQTPAHTLRQRPFSLRSEQKTKTLVYINTVAQTGKIDWTRKRKMF